jgi:8-oxo-dGTP diphosphatase
VLPWCCYQFNNTQNEGQQNIGFRCVRVIKNNDPKSDKVFFAGGIVVSEYNGNICVLLRKSKLSEKWGLPKGKLNGEEELKTCAIREVLQETGHTVSVDKFVDFTNWSYVDRSHIFDGIEFFFLMHIIKAPTTLLSDSVAWVDIEHIDDITMHENEKRVLEKGIQLFHGGESK